MSDPRGKSRRILVQISPDESLPEVLTRLRSYAGKTVDLEIPDHSPILLTATEFRTLKDAAQRSQITLGLKTDDRLRIQLASMFDLVEGLTISRRGKDASRGSGDLVTTSAGWRSASEQEATESDPISVSRRRRNVMERSRLEEATEPKRSRANRDTSDESGTLDYLDKPESTSRLNAKLLGRIVAILAVIVLVAGIAGWYYMPEVAITATLREEQIGGELVYAVGLPDASLPSDVQFLIEATSSSAEVTIEFSIPATGGVVEPDGTASGSVVLRNPTTAPINVPSGTTIQNNLGVAFTTTAAADVPATSGETPGETTVTVQAAEPGSGSNVAQGALTGKIDGMEVYFSNRQAPIEGGTDRQILEVTQEDIDSLETQLQDQIKQVTAEGWSRQLPAGQTLVRPSVTPETPEYEIQQEVGETSDVVSLTGTVQATGLVYAQEDIEDDLKAEFQNQLNATVPSGYGLLANTITLGEASVMSEQPSAVIYRQSATATVQAVFDETARQNLVNALAGKSYDTASAIVAGQTAFATSSIELSPGFWPERMPQTAERITLEIAPGSEQLPEPESSPQPDGTASPEGSP
jgi:hypothetical protein